jgi:hypothetical protein
VLTEIQNIDAPTADVGPVFETLRSGSSFQLVCAALTVGMVHPLQWDAVIVEANRHLILPALYVFLRDRDLLRFAPTDVEKYLGFIHHLNELRNLRLRQQVLELVKALNSVGIEPLLIKGAALLLALPESRLGARMVSDLDVVVDNEVIETCVAQLVNLGYRPLAGDPGVHAYGKFYRPSDAGSLDLHLRPPGPVALFSTDGAVRSRVVEVAGARLRLPSPEEWVTHLIVHDMIQDRRLRTGEVDLRRLLDCRELLALGYGIDWSAVCRRLPSGRLALGREVFMLNLQRLIDVKIEGHVSGILPRILYRRQIAIKHNVSYRRLDRLGLSVARSAWRIIRLHKVQRRWERA